MTDTQVKARTRATAVARRAPPLRLLLRQAHLYLGMFIAPSVLFFALTGMLQLFSLHEPHGDYRPPALVEKLGMLHKDQVFALKPRRPPPAAATAARPRPQTPEPGPKPQVLALRVFFFGVGASLVVSTLLGAWMGVTQSRRRLLVWTLLAAGALIPLGLALV